MSLQDQFVQAMGDAFRERVTTAIVRGATIVFNENAGTANHANRISLAQLIVRNPTHFASAFALVLASRGLGDTSTDQEVLQGIAAAWDLMAGVQ